MSAFDNEELLKELHKIDCIQDLLEYNKTKKNSNTCEPFEDLNRKYILLQKRYAGSFHELNENIKAKICRREYSKGGVSLQRGFYSPSMLDLVVGGCNRGRLLKRPPKDNNYDYEYIFDNQDNIICVQKYSSEFDGVFCVISIELFIYQQDRVLSFEFDPYHNHSLTFISECRHENGRLTRYESALCELCYDGKGCTEINVETIGYENDLLKSLCWYRYTPSIQLIDQNKYIFTRDEEGFLSTYTIAQIGEFEPKTDFNYIPEPYRVRVKRR